MSNIKKGTTSNSAKCQPMTAINLSPRSSQKRANRIAWNLYDEQAAEIFSKIKAGKEEVVRPSAVIPESRYADVRQLLALKRQSYQQYTWALILQDLDNHAKSGSLIPFLIPG